MVSSQTLRGSQKFREICPTKPPNTHGTTKFLRSSSSSSLATGVFACWRVGVLAYWSVDVEPV